jgi:hypothetical protein
VFEGEKRVYRDEGLDDSAIAFTDNAMVLEMVSVLVPRKQPNIPSERGEFSDISARKDKCGVFAAWFLANSAGNVAGFHGVVTCVNHCVALLLRCVIVVADRDTILTIKRKGFRRYS